MCIKWFELKYYNAITACEYMNVVWTVLLSSAILLNNAMLFFISEASAIQNIHKKHEKCTSRYSITINLIIIKYMLIVQYPKQPDGPPRNINNPCSGPGEW